MDESAFFRRCKALARDTSDATWSSDELAGFFQQFRPDGRELEGLFADIPAGPEVFSRLREIYDATTAPPEDPRRSDLYFIVRKPARTSDEHLLRRAADQLANWRQMAVDRNEQELIALLTPLPEIRISKGPSPPIDPTDNNSLDVFIYDVQTDWHCYLEPLTPHADWMREAFYYINCDYYLASYVTWPWYRRLSKIWEPFEPYFDLWLHGAELRCLSPDRITLFVPPPSGNE